MNSHTGSHELCGGRPAAHEYASAKAQPAAFFISLLSNTSKGLRPMFTMMGQQKVERKSAVVTKRIPKGSQ